MESTVKNGYNPGFLLWKVIMSNDIVKGKAFAFLLTILF